jgi:histone H3/H4
MKSLDKKSRRKAKRGSGALEGNFDFKPYIRRVLKNINEKRTISSEAMEAMDNMIRALSDQLLEELPQLIDGRKQTLTDREIIYAGRMVLKSELQKYAFLAISIALGNYEASYGEKKDNKQSKK